MVIVAGGRRGFRIADTHFDRSGNDWEPMVAAGRRGSTLVSGAPSPHPPDIHDTTPVGAPPLLTALAWSMGDHVQIVCVRPRHVWFPSAPAGATAAHHVSTLVPLLWPAVLQVGPLSARHARRFGGHVDGGGGVALQGGGGMCGALAVLPRFPFATLLGGMTMTAG